jgi:hypothetical protein
MIYVQDLFRVQCCVYSLTLAVLLFGSLASQTWQSVTTRGILEKKSFFYLEFTTKHSNNFPLHYNPYMPETFDAHVILSDHICQQNNCLVLKDVL